MPFYKFVCPNGHETDQFRPLNKYVERIKCKHWVPNDVTELVAYGTTGSRPCGLRAVISISPKLEVSIFQPYVEKNMGHKPVRIENKQQRDALCEKHGVTYDSGKYLKKPKYRPAVEDITLGDVKEAHERGRTPDGDKIEPPLKISKKERDAYKAIKLVGSKAND